MIKLLDGRKPAEVLSGELKERVDRLKAGGVQPSLILIYNDRVQEAASYVGSIARKTEALGIQCDIHSFDAGDEEKLGAFIEAKNEDAGVHAIMVAKPLAMNLNETALDELIAPTKDVDGLGSGSMAAVYAGRKGYHQPCTALACMHILDYYDIPIEGTHAVVIGRSTVIGKPAAMMLQARNATVTMCHSKTQDLASYARMADIVVSAAGRARFLGREFVRDGQVILDVGINFDEDGKLCGDVDAADIEGFDLSLTPVPGGIGSITTALLCRNIIDAAEKAPGE